MITLTIDDFAKQMKWMFLLLYGKIGDSYSLEVATTAHVTFLF
jgi:hypothetical protein